MSEPCGRLKIAFVPSFIYVDLCPSVVELHCSSLVGLDDRPDGQFVANIGFPASRYEWTPTIADDRIRRVMKSQPILIIKTLVWLAAIFAAVGAKSATNSPVLEPFFTNPNVTYVTTMPNSRHPELVYWFWTKETLKDRHYLEDVRAVAERSRFNFLMMTDRTVGQGSLFHNTGKMHDIFAEVVKLAHARGLKVGLQLWAEGYPKLTQADAVACVSEGEVVLDAAGRALYSATNRWVREGGADATTGKHEPITSEPLKAFAFRKTAEGLYEPGSLVELPATDLTVVQSDAGSVSLKIDASSQLAGDHVYLLVAHYLQFPDLFNDVMTAHLENTLSHYRDIPFDGTALDEFGWMMIKREQPDKSAFRDRFYGQAFAREFSRLNGRSLETELFNMRYAPADNPSVRIRAINDYFEVLRQGPLRVENAFYAFSKKLYGPKTFAGIHDTFHNGLETDEIWRTGLNWWRIPRAYGQSDENISLPVRMGLLLSATEPVTYDQYYSPDVASYTKKVMAEARYNGRTHYHAWNDGGRWGRDMGDTNVLKVINALEEKVRLLNQFDPAPPKLPLLIIFGLPAQLNWFPHATARNQWDINTLGIEKQAVAVWNAGYPCALVPSDLIDNGKISIDAVGHPVLNGHTFEAMTYLYPEYATPRTLAFLEQFAKAGGKFMIGGEATRDFAGNDITRRFTDIAAKASTRGFSVGQIPALGMARSTNQNMAYLEDGSVICSDVNSFTTGKPQPFAISLVAHTWSGAYVGVLALKANASGRIEKLAAGGLSQLLCDGKTILSLASPADIVLRQETNGQYQILIKGSVETNRVHLE